MTERREGALMTSQRILVAGILVLASLAGCTARPASDSTAVTAATATTTKSPLSSAGVTASPVLDLPIDPSITPVSAKAPGGEAGEVLSECNIGDQILLSRVTGMGRIDSAGDLVRYVPLTGREPQLRDRGPAWIVTIDAEIPQPGSSEVWIDPTCVVTSSGSGYFATGPVKDASSGRITLPEAPATPPVFRVPPLAE